MLNTEKFIEKARKVHGDKYDYSKVDYKYCRTHVCIICPVHGEFWQTPQTHLVGSGCPECGKISSALKSKLTQEEFIEKAKKIHGNKYNYSKVKYNGWDKKVCIVCPEHGEFWQTPSEHIHKHQKHGCPKCGEIKSKILSLTKGRETFKKFLEEHSLYVANIDDYVNRNTPITIICKKHGPFQITPNSLFLQKTPCPNCREELKKPKKEKKVIDYKQEFIHKLEVKYPNRFGYEKTSYVNRETEICLYDKILKEYVTVNPSSLLSCNSLSKVKGYEKTNLPTVEFIEKARKIHGDKYNYSKVNYVDSKTKVCIICPEHGEWWQTPNQHLKGCGCSYCAGNVKWKVEDYITKAKKIHGDKYDYCRMVLGKQANHITLICPIHGEFEIRAMHHLKGSGCPKCKGSGGEKALMTFFENKGLYPQYNKFYKWLNNYQLDFYFPEYKLAIEVQGRQHFEEKIFFHKTLDEQTKRDFKKKKLCEENGVTLLYYANYNMEFPYKVYTSVEELYEAMKPFMKNI